MELQKQYIQEIESRFPLLDKFEKINKKVAVTLEETLLARLILDGGSNVTELEDFEHLREGLK